MKLFVGALSASQIKTLPSGEQIRKDDLDLMLVLAPSLEVAVGYFEDGNRNKHPYRNRWDRHNVSVGCLTGPVATLAKHEGVTVAELLDAVFSNEQGSPQGDLSKAELHTLAAFVNVRFSGSETDLGLAEMSPEGLRLLAQMQATELARLAGENKVLRTEVDLLSGQ